MAAITIGRVLDASTDSVETKELHKLINVEFDTVELIPSDVQPTTVRYRQGGIAGSIVATLTLTYNAGNELISVVRT